MRQVKRIEVIADRFHRKFEIGQVIAFKYVNNEKVPITITSIEDNSLELPNSLDLIYTVKSEGVIYFSIENCRCIVEYAEGE